jgi:transglutaminase-like putative cysteine protease
MRLAEAARTVGPTASFYTISMGSGAIGYATSTVDTLPDAIRVQDEMTVDIEALGSVQRTQLLTDTRLSRAFHLRSFTASLISPAGTFRASGEVQGDSVLAIELVTGGNAPQRSRVRLDRPITLSSLLPLALAVGRQLEVGRTYRIRLFDPMLMQSQETDVSILAESTLVVPDSARFDSTAQRWVAARADTVRAWKVSQQYGGVGITTWVDRQGRVVSATSPIGFRMERTAFELAVENWRRAQGAARPAGGRGEDVIAATAIAANVTLQPETLSELRVVLRNVTLEGFDLGGGRQQLLGDTLVVHRETGASLAAPAAVRLPGLLARLPIRDTALDAELAAEPLVQSNDPRIQAQARLIAGRERRAGPVAQLLTHWVYENLEKRITISVPSALQVLEDRRGDCNEHTVLYVALARSLGLPARSAAGVVYLRGRFYYHAWPEVWLGQWVAVDPTFDQYPADASHLRFVVGGLARQVELIRLIGRLELTVVPPGR